MRKSAHPGVEAHAHLAEFVVAHLDRDWMRRRHGCASEVGGCQHVRSGIEGYAKCSVGLGLDRRHLAAGVGSRHRETGRRRLVRAGLLVGGGRTAGVHDYMAEHARIEGRLTTSGLESARRQHGQRRSEQCCHSRQQFLRQDPGSLQDRHGGCRDVGQGISHGTPWCDLERPRLIPAHTARHGPTSEVQVSTAIVSDEKKGNAVISQDSVRVADLF